MAAILKREHQLMSLRIEVELWSGKPQVVIGFEAGGGLCKKWSLPATTLGLGQESSACEIPRLPVEVAGEITALTRDYAQTGPSEPLWVHLVRPYGCLGVARWEKALADIVQRPILRLPDFLERSKEDPDILEIAVCYDPPWKSDVESAHKRVSEVISSALQSPRPQILVHLFTTPEASEILGSQTDPRLKIHNPNVLRAKTAGSIVKYSSPWLDWMGRTLEDRALDAVHFVCATESADERAALLLRASLGTEKLLSLSSVHVAEVTSFLQRTGAWAALFSPPPASSTTDSCRYFADALAQNRPGPVLFHEFSDDQLSRGQLDNVYRFLFAPEPIDAPVLREDFLYCQPALVSNYEDWGDEKLHEVRRLRASYLSRTLARVSQQSDIIPDFHLPEAPAWTSAAQRFVEKASLDVARLQRSTQGSFLVDAVRNSALSANNAVQETLGEIQKIIDRHAKPRQDDR